MPPSLSPKSILSKTYACGEFMPAMPTALESAVRPQAPGHPWAPRHTIAQLQLALQTQQKAIESIFNGGGDVEREIRSADAKLNAALKPSARHASPASPVSPVSPVSPTLSQLGPSLVSFGASRASGRTSRDSASESSEVSLAPTGPTAKLYTPGTTPRTTWFKAWLHMTGKM